MPNFKEHKGYQLIAENYDGSYFETFKFPSGYNLPFVLAQAEELSKVPSADHNGDKCRVMVRVQKVYDHYILYDNGTWDKFEWREEHSSFDQGVMTEGVK